MIRRSNLASIVVAVALALGLTAEPTAMPQKASSYALLVGTVFYEESGRLFRGAEVEVRQKEGKKHWSGSTNDAGEFAIRVPAGKAVYIVEAKAPGREKASKEVEVNADERVDIVLHLKGK